MTGLEKVAHWAQKEREAAAQRDAAVVEARSEGASLREIGAAAGLTHVGIAKLLERVGPLQRI